MAKKRGAARMRRYSSEVWQLGAVRLPQWMTRSDGEVCQGWMAVCAREGPNSFQLSEIGPEEKVPQLLEGVIERALRRWRTRPWRIQVSDPAWVPALESALTPRGLVVEAGEDLPLLSGLLESLPRRLALLDPTPAQPLSRATGSRRTVSPLWPGPPPRSWPLPGGAISMRTT
jgi:hypothetical protein